MIAAVNIDASDPTPPYEQLRRQLATLIESGVIEGGTKLAPVRQMASDLGIAAGTVSRAYRELESTGLVRTRRGGGTVVSSEIRQLAGRARNERLAAVVDDAVRRARVLGATDAEIAEHVRHALRSVPD